METLTIFTPAYNRAHTLPRTYQSLLNQDCKDFIWLIVDDGSSDHTAELVNTWKKNNNGFDIQYIHKINGGMHTAHNVAYENIQTELNVCVDSDDYLADDSVHKIITAWNSIKSQDYAGIIGLNADPQGNIIGKGFLPHQKETTLSDYYASGGAGDKKLIYRTDVIKKYPPYPVFDGEKYVALAYKYRLIDQDYKLAILDEVLCHVDYQADGHSTIMWKEYVRSPRGFACWRKLCMEYPESKKRLIIDCIHYVSSSILSGNPKYIAESPRKLLTILCTIPGILLTCYIRSKVK